MFNNFWKLGQEVWAIEQARTSGGVPSAAGANPTFAVYDGAGNIVATGTATPFDTGNLTGAYRCGVVTAAPDFSRGIPYVIIVKYTVGGAARAGYHSFILS